MKKLIAACFALGTLAASAAVIEPGKVEVVVAKHRANGTVAFAVEELTSALDRALGSVPRVCAPSADSKKDGTVRIYLGEAAGLAPCRHPGRRHA